MLRTRPRNSRASRANAPKHSRLLHDHADLTVATTPIRNFYLTAQLLLLENNKVEAKKYADAILARFPQHDRAQTLASMLEVPPPPVVGKKGAKPAAAIVGEPKVGTERAAAPSQGTADYKKLVGQAGKLFAEGKVKMARQMYQSALAIIAERNRSAARLGVLRSRHGALRCIDRRVSARSRAAAS